MGIFRRQSERGNAGIVQLLYEKKRESLVQRRLHLLLILVLFLTETNTQGDHCHCSDIVYVEREKSGRIPCSCGHFDVVSWYTKDGFDSNEPPLIFFDKVSKQGPGYDSREYDIEQNGSLIIKNVSSWLEMEYVVKFRQFDNVLPDTKGVRAVVLVPPVPAYPVVNDFTNQQLIYMEAERNGKLTCSMRLVHPKVNLTWEVIDPSKNDKLEFLFNDMKSMPNEDGTFNVTLNSLYKADLFERTSVIQCKVTDQVSEYFPGMVTVGLAFPPVPPVPVIDGCYSQQDHCVLEVERTGELTCTVKNSPYLVDLRWNLPASTSPSTFNEETVIQNKSTSFDKFSILSYSVGDRSSAKLTVHCEIINSDDGLLLAKKTVSLQFRKAAGSNCLDDQIKRLTVAVLILMIIFFAVAFCHFSGIFNKLKKKITRPD